MLQVLVRKQFQEADKFHSRGVYAPVGRVKAKAKPCTVFYKGLPDIKVERRREAVHVLRAVSCLRGKQQENKNTAVRRGGRRGQEVLVEICARQISNCNRLQRCLTPPATGVAAGTDCISQELPCSRVQLPDPRDPRGGRVGRHIMSQFTS